MLIFNKNYFSPWHHTAPQALVWLWSLFVTAIQMFLFAFLLGNSDDISLFSCV